MIFSTVDGLKPFSDRRSVLLDGCFDPIHVGHIRYIRNAKLMFPEGRIVVAVASDDEIRAKGREPLFDQMARCQAVDGLAGVEMVVAKDRPTHEVLSALKPGAYVKGKDWTDRLPADQRTACALSNVQIVYLGERRDSSSDRLRAWALNDAEQSLDRLETFMAGQSPPVPWKPVTDYSFEARKAIEGDHPRLIKDVFKPTTVLDVGCGPQGHLVRLLRELDVEAYGCDLQPPESSYFFRYDMTSCVGCIPRTAPLITDADVVICRECLEHLTVKQVGEAVRNLFLLSMRYVYITTRFSGDAVFDAATDLETDPTHITCLTQPFLRSLCVLNGGKRRRDLEDTLDHQKKGRVLVYEL